MKKIIYYLFLILPFIDLITSFIERINGNMRSTYKKGVVPCEMHGLDLVNTI